MGWKTLKEISQGRKIEAVFWKSFAPQITYGLANVGVLNRGYGPKQPRSSTVPDENISMPEEQGSPEGGFKRDAAQDNVEGRSKTSFPKRWPPVGGWSCKTLAAH